MTSIFDRDLPPNPANHKPLSPIQFLDWAASVYPARTAVIHGARRIAYAEFRTRCRRLASALGRRGIGTGDTVAAMLPNVPAMLEAHYGVPMAGAVLNALNYRLDARTIAFILDHGEARVLLTDRQFSTTIREALSLCRTPPLVVDVDDPEAQGDLLGAIEYEALLAEGDPEAPGLWPADEWQALSLCYTSGTTGDPKGVVYHHRGAFLAAQSNAFAFGLDRRSVYLWTLPMFHCNGWSFTWAVTAAAATHVCLRAVEPARIFRLIAEEGVTHLCGAPVVLSMLIHAPAEAKAAFPQIVEVATGGAAPPSAVIAGMERMGFRVTHLYGLTESYGPATICAWQDGWDGLPLDEKALMMARQGVRLSGQGDMMVADPSTMVPVPADGRTLGELMLRGNTTMKGYLKNPTATTAAFAGGWYRTGDLAVMHADGYAEVKDRSKDIIISGGENISSLEVEEVLYRHPAVMEAAVVARPDEKWGETPCAFVALKPGAEADAAAIIAFCRQNMAHFKVPRHVVFGALPKTSTGKIQKYLLRERARRQ